MIRCYFQNIRGLRSKAYDLLLLIKKYKIDILMLQETWLSQNVEFKLKGFKVYRQDRVNNPRGGGIAIICKENLDTEVINSNEIMEMGEVNELQFVTIKLKTNKGSNLEISSVYSQPKKNLKETVLREMMKSENALLMGDLNCRNIKLGSIYTDGKGKVLEELISENNYLHHQLPRHTHTWNKKGELKEDTIDYLLSSTNLKEKIVNIVGIDDIGSDHRGFLFDLEEELEKVEELKELRKKLREEDWVDINNNVGRKIEVLLNEMEYEGKNREETKDGIDRILRNLEVIIREEIEEKEKVIRVKTRGDKMPREIIILIKDKRRLRRAFIKTRDRDIKTQINRINKKIKREMDKIRKGKINKTLEEWLDKGERKQWLNVKRLMGIKNKDMNIGPLTVGGELITDKKDILREFKGKIEEVFATPPEKFRGRYNTHFQAVIKNMFKKPLENKGYEVTKKEISKLIKNLKNNKAPGHDGITNETIKKLAKSLEPLLHKLFNILINRAIFPDRWKIAVMRMIHKPGKKRQCPGSYRPLSLTPTLGKMYEKVIQKRFTEWLKENNILNDQQNGFRKYRNINVNLTQEVREAFSEGKNVQAVFLDVEKAFDQVWHEGLYRKMTGRNCPEYLKLSVMDFMMDRRITIRVDQLHSTLIKPIQGVPQGSPLSPVLFIFYVSDIPQPKNGISLSQFADDIGLWRKEHKNEAEATKKINKYLKKLYKWCIQWLINLNAFKSEAITFYYKGSAVPNNKEELEMGGVNIERKKEVKFLGLHIDENFELRGHAEKCIAKTFHIRNEIITLANVHKDPKSLLILYKIFIRSVIEYASPAIISMEDKGKKELIKYENNLIKTCLNLPTSFSNKESRKMANIEVIDERILTLAKKWFQKTTMHVEEFKSYTEKCKLAYRAPCTIIKSE